MVRYIYTGYNVKEVKVRLQLDNPISEKEDAEKEVTILTYVDRSFEQDLTFIDGLVKTRSQSFLSDPSQLELEKVLNKHMIILWSLEAYPDLITGIKPEDRSQIKEFVEKKLFDFARYKLLGRIPGD